MKPASSIRILVADDHYIVRMGLASLVSSETDMEVVGEAVNGVQAVELYAKLKPDLVLMDLSMPIKDGIQATNEIRARFPEARVLMLTTFDGDEDIHRALQAGAQGYLLKNSTGENLIPALRTVAAGQRWIPKDVASRLNTRKLFEELTPREVEVLRQLSHGMANREIAEALAISEHTVKDHLKNILGKLQADDRTEAVTKAISRGIIHL
jgi:DNA-binding NarL/FixJ family response regulator